MMYKGLMMVKDTKGEIICDFGCKNIAKYTFNNGKHCCSQYSSQCPAKRKIFSEKSKGHTLSDEVKKKLSKNTKKLWKTKSFRKNILSGIRSPETTKKKSESMRELYNRPEEKIKLAERTTDTWKNKKIRNKRISSLIKSSQDPERRKKISEFQNNLCKDPKEIERRRQSMLKVWATTEFREKRLKVMKSEEVRAKISETVSQLYVDGVYDNRKDIFTSGKFYSQKNKDLYVYRSSYELKAYEILENDQNILAYTYEPFKIQYMYKGHKKYTIPDLLVYRRTDDPLKIKLEVIEVKPENRMKEDLNKCKFNAMEDFSNQMGLDFKIWNEQHLGINSNG